MVTNADGAFTQTENSIFELLVDNLGRLNEEEESDRQGVFPHSGYVVL